ncbi:peptidylprolyl isomerase [Aquimarina sp. D1M17]|uniref:peptidylprolyl isomerase n=1 Tax=Aquimarina acroporae TaxID=2937283 RepID=UPI0020BEAFF7|nr:peptidylprolyl isomerase [Aquimarina acroporae]MCK8522776.1 peptidylprolyl isomerase [Aquimarina acroporae]
MKTLNLLFLAIVLVAFGSCNEKYPDLNDGLYAEIVTNQGTVVAKLHHTLTPMTVANFVSLAEGTNTMVDSSYVGKKYYNGIIFHRVIEDFMIQTGDPLGTGTGDPGYKFPDEFVDSLKHKSKGILSMANSGPNTNGSQFFITLKETPWLDGKHTVFGEVILGQDVVDSIGTTKTGARNKPVEDIKMLEVNIIRKGKDAKSFDTETAFTQRIKEIEEEKAEKEKLIKERDDKIAADYAKLKETATKYDSGLEMVFLNKGTGEQPKTGDNILVNYEGYLANGKMFDTSYEEKAKEFGVFNPRRGPYGPIPMPYSPDARMIPGFKEGALQMKNVGDKAILFIPSHLAYGERGSGPIPPNSDLIFELEIMDIADPNTPPPGHSKNDGHNH